MRNVPPFRRNHIRDATRRKSRQEKTENKDIEVEPSRGQPTVNPWYSETKWKIGQEKKKREIQPTPQPALPPPKPIRKYQLSEIPQQQNPHNVLPTRPYTEIFAHVAPQEDREHQCRKTNTPTLSAEKSFYMSIFFFFFGELV